MILDIIKVQTVEAEEKDTIYKVTLRGFDCNLVKMQMTIESDSKRDIQRYVPLMVGERRGIELRLLDRTLDEFQTDAEDMAAYEKRIADAKALEEGSA